ncbi:DNA-processing protein DprA [Colwellia psychrerythraea]|uniref:DNA protecting protein DprA n=1 Tax=Colwellia psychrerythraea TaxID=28229 RepID=A0A099L168_COLPS|nr:DNA-processing protein DprA [Colwellia psychrerythraea]KGJ96724.1 DNA protecting protein DprA [Colwellia psychrerythraea]
MINRSKSNVDYWLALRLVPRLAIHKKRALVETFGLTALFSFNSQPSVLTSANGLSAKQLSYFYRPNWQYITQIIHASSICNSDIVCFDDMRYPQLLKQIYDPPLVLFIQGNSSLLNAPQLAVVGSRSASAGGRDTAFSLCEQLAQQNIVITSGLALGIDAAAHRGALNEDTGTIAVVATGLDQVYPARHLSLAQQIIASGGAVISEFLPGTPARAGHFPKRNRLISGLSLGVLVVEAELKSGSLITARCALEQNREVFAIPSSIKNQQAKGCHWLIKQGAKLVEQCADIIEEFAFAEQPSLHLNSKEQLLMPVVQDTNRGVDEKNQKGLCNDALLASVGFEITPVDKVVLRSELPVEEVLTRLTMLELSGLVTAVPGGYIRTQ